MTNINFKVIGLTRPVFETAMSESTDLPKWEMDVLHIWPSCQVRLYTHTRAHAHTHGLTHTHTHTHTGVHIYVCVYILLSRIWPSHMRCRKGLYKKNPCATELIAASIERCSMRTKFKICSTINQQRLSLILTDADHEHHQYGYWMVNTKKEREKKN